jgi:squalene-hopene/tetraprenyl-beta-curcumene cyclase
MTATLHVRLASPEGLGSDAPFHDGDSLSSQSPRLSSQLRRAVVRTRQWLLAQQQADGFWVGELEGDTILESEYILLLAFLEQEDSPRAEAAARYILKQQNEAGGWAQYPGGPIDISQTVKAYFALKLTGHDPSSEPMQRARACVLRHGGADAVNSFTRFYLALLGQISYDQCPAVPPEAVLLPNWFPINLNAVSSWSRTIIVPLSIMWACRPVREVSPEHGIRELFLKQPQDWPALRCPGMERKTGLLSWDRFFRVVDHGLKFLERRGWVPAREKALATSERWMIERFAGSDGLGAIFPPMVWSIIALRSLGYADDRPEMKYCLEQLEGLVIEEEGTVRLQPCMSPVWDTAITLRALADSGLASDDAAVQHGVEWLLDREITRRGDWAARTDAPAGGWCFEHNNDFYPDCDDTAMVIMALWRQFERTPVELPESYGIHVRDEQVQHSTHLNSTLDRATGAIARAERWLLGMQNKDGGWGAFDRDNSSEFLCHVPFADHNAMIDPSTPDLAARVLEALGCLGRRVGNPAIDRAVKYLRATQEADGAWFGRWGVNYIYGTWQVITGLRAVGVSERDPAIVAATNWLIAHQQPNGAWGESADSYAEPHLRGQGNATASQTAWALLGLLAAGKHDHPAVARGVRYLIDTQRPDGGWDEPEFTGTGFPRVFYLRYHLYPIYFPLMALAQYARVTEATREQEARSKRPEVRIFN